MRNSRPALYLHKLLLLLFAGFAVAIPGNAAVVTHKVSLSSDTKVATAGYFQLSWKGDEKHARYRVLESDNPLFNESKIVYQGAKRSTTISDRANGDYYYRVVELQGDTPISASNTIKVHVAYHPVSKIILPFIIGIIIFLAALLLILWNKHKNRNGDS